MKRVFFYVMAGALLAAPLMAQAQGTGMPVKPKMQSENLAPLKVEQPVNAGVVSGVSVTLPETDGFARDVALTEAARKGFPIALGQLETPVAPEKAAEIAKSVGEPMQFVKSYKIVKEVLVPTYSLTVDLVFDAQKLQANFGKLETTTTTSGTSVSGTWSTGETSVTTVGVPVTLKVEAATAAGQDKVFNTLSKAGLKPVWKTIDRAGGEIVVNSALQGEALRDKVAGLGFEAEVDGAGLIVKAE